MGQLTLGHHRIKIFTLYVKTQFYYETNTIF